MTTGALLALTGQPSPQLSSGDSSDNDFTYSLAPRWHVSSNTMVYGRLATGYRPGGPNDLPPNTPSSVQRQYEPDKTTNYEVGVRTDLLDKRVSIDVAAFLVDWKKIQLFEEVQVPGYPPFGINANGGSARTKGIEWTLGYTPVTGLTFTLVGAYVDAYLTAPAPEAGGNEWRSAALRAEMEHLAGRGLHVACVR